LVIPFANLSFYYDHTPEVGNPVFLRAVSSEHTSWRRGRLIEKRSFETNTSAWVKEKEGL